MIALPGATTEATVASTTAPSQKKNRHDPLVPPCRRASLTASRKLSERQPLFFDLPVALLHTQQANAAARATLGLEALYAAVNAGRKQGRPSEGAVSPSPRSRSGSVPTADAQNETAHELAKQGGGVKGGVPLTSRVSVASLATMPLIGHRYRCVATIGTGTFAVVIR